MGCVLTLGRAPELEGGGGGDNSVGEESEEWEKSISAWSFPLDRHPSCCACQGRSTTAPWCRSFNSASRSPRRRRQKAITQYLLYRTIDKTPLIRTIFLWDECILITERQCTLKYKSWRLARRIVVQIYKWTAHTYQGQAMFVSKLRNMLNVILAMSAFIW